MGPRAVAAGARLPYSSIQVGLGRDMIGAFVEEGVVGIEDYTTRVRKIYGLLQSGKADKAKRHLPPERVYPVGGEIARRLRIKC